MSTQNRGFERQAKIVALNAKMKMNDGSERQTESTALNVKLKKWLWTPKLRKMVTQNIWRGMKNNSEGQN